MNVPPELARLTDRIGEAVTLRETYYREESGPPAVATGTKHRGAGTISFEPAQHGIHRIANDGGALAISLHVYGVAPELISTSVNRLVGKA